MYHYSNDQVATGGFAPADARAFRAWVTGQTVDYLAELIRKAVKRHQQKRAVAELRSLDNRALKDIGLHRSGILSVVYTEEPHREARRNDYD